MNEDKLRNLDLDKLIKKVAEMPEDEFARISAKAEDKEAARNGIERITLFLKDNQTMLLVKPQESVGIWVLNLSNFGCLTIDAQAKVKPSVTVLPGDLHRLYFTMESSTYWLDLIDEDMARECAEFLGVEIENPISSDQ